MKGNLGAGPRLPTVRGGKINSSNRSRLSSVGISRQHARFAIFAPQKGGACLESGVRARIQRFQHPTRGTDLAENPQRVAYERAARQVIPLPTIQKKKRSQASPDSLCTIVDLNREIRHLIRSPLPNNKV